MKEKHQLRTHLSAVGSFVSLPEAFTSADPGVKLAPKIEVQVAKFADSKKPLGVENVMYPHHVLVDLEAVDAKELDLKKVMKDCELMITACKEYPDQVRSILEAFAKDAPHEKILEADKIAEKLRISESMAVKAGGGMLWLLVIAAAIALSGCKSCAHTEGSMRQ
jgi:hypothetical protein